MQASVSYKSYIDEINIFSISNAFYKTTDDMKHNNKSPSTDIQMLQPTNCNHIFDIFINWKANSLPTCQLRTDKCYATVEQSEITNSKEPPTKTELLDSLTNIC